MVDNAPGCPFGEAALKNRRALRDAPRHELRRFIAGKAHSAHCGAVEAQADADAGLSRRSVSTWKRRRATRSCGVIDASAPGIGRNISLLTQLGSTWTARRGGQPAPNSRSRRRIRRLGMKARTTPTDAHRLRDRVAAGLRHVGVVLQADLRRIEQGRRITRFGENPLVKGVCGPRRWLTREKRTSTPHKLIKRSDHGTYPAFATHEKRCDNTPRGSRTTSARPFRVQMRTASGGSPELAGPPGLPRGTYARSGASVSVFHATAANAGKRQVRGQGFSERNSARHLRT